MAPRAGAAAPLANAPMAPWRVFASIFAISQPRCDCTPRPVSLMQAFLLQMMSIDLSRCTIALNDAWKHICERVAKWRAWPYSNVTRSHWGPRGKGPDFTAISLNMSL